MKYKKLFVILLAVSVVMQLLSGCEETRKRLEPLVVKPQLVINNGSMSTRDTLLRVSIKSAEQYTTMQYNYKPVFNNIQWLVRDSVFNISVPPLEGMATVYARFAAPCCTSAICSASVRLDFTATIDSFQVIATDTLGPGSQVNFTMRTGEEGSAEVSFGQAIVRYPLRRIEAGLYSGVLAIRDGMAEDSAQATGWFTDQAGNEADPVSPAKWFKVTGPALNPVRLGTVETEIANGNAILAKGSYCYVANGSDSRVTFFDVRNPEKPELLPNGLIVTMGWVHGMDEGAGLLHGAAGQVGLISIHTSSGDMGKVDRSVRVSGSPRDVVVKPPILYLSALFDGLKIFRVAPGADPVQISELALEYSGEHLEVDGNIAYVAGGGGVSVVDVSNLELPRLITQIPLQREPSGLIYANRRLIIPCTTGDIFVVDVHNPHVPVMLQQTGRFTHINGLAYSSPYLFVSEDFQITIVNASDPAMKVVDKITASKNCHAICIDDGKLYVSTGTGLDIYRLYGN